MSRSKRRRGPRGGDANRAWRRANARLERPSVPNVAVTIPATLHDGQPAIGLARLLPGEADRHRPCGCGPYDPYTAHAEEWRACGFVISHLYLG